MLFSKRTNSNSHQKNRRGQSLVEMAIIAPILIFMIIGLYEVGALLWGYMTLLNVDREATRFSIISGALDFSQPPADTLEESYEQIGYRSVITHTLRSNAAQLELTDYLADIDEANPNATIIVTHLVVDTRQPCNSYPKGNKDEDCFETEAECLANEYKNDDLIMHPDLEGREYLRYTSPTTQSVFSTRLNVTEMAEKLKEDNNKLNCNLWKKLGVDAQPEWSDNSTMTVEMFYEKPQILDFPLFSWLLNPFPLYAQTTMRVDSNDYSPCELFPIIACRETIVSMLDGSERNILDDPGDCERKTGEKIWVAWNPYDDQSATYLLDEFQNPREVLTHYVDPIDPSDRSDIELNIGDYVQALVGTVNAGDIRAVLDKLKNKPILIPVYDSVHGSGSNAAYHIVGFAEVRLRSHELEHEIIMGVVDRYPVTDVCLGNP